jgi:heme-degrading monooxygenase HmoA
MYSASFIFEPGAYDDKFLALDALIQTAANETVGYLGQESWASADGNKRNAMYYWSSLDSLKEFSTHPKHLEAKRQYQQWYLGFHIVISEVLKSYGDGAFAHITPNQRARPA